MFEGDIPSENITAWSTPRRSSAIFAQLLVENTRIKVPYMGHRWLGRSKKIDTVTLTASLAVARTSPSGLSSMALNGELCAGMMLTLPVSSSTSWTWPGDRPGNANSFLPKQASPSGLSDVSKTESFWGGLEKAKTWMLLSRATMIRDLDRRTRRTDVRNSRVITAFCFASSQMTNLQGDQIPLRQHQWSTDGRTLF